MEVDDTKLVIQAIKEQIRTTASLSTGVENDW
jgi:hypothetical protein